MNTQPFNQTGQMIELSCEYLSQRCIWLHVIIMLRTSFRVNLHSIVSLMSHTSVRVNLNFIFCLNVKEILAWSWCHIGSLSDSNVIRTHNHLVRKQRFNQLAKLANDWAVLWVLICTVHLAACHYHATYECQSKFKLYNLLECQGNSSLKQMP